MPYGLPDAQWTAARDDMRDVLTGRARAGRVITYGELAREIGAARLEPRHRRFGALLQEACDAEVASDRPDPGPLVVKADTGIPGEGYFRGASGTLLDAGSRRAHWERELAGVFAFWAKSPSEVAR